MSGESGSSEEERSESFATIMQQKRKPLFPPKKSSIVEASQEKQQDQCPRRVVKPTTKVRESDETVKQSVTSKFYILNCYGYTKEKCKQLYFYKMLQFDCIYGIS